MLLPGVAQQFDLALIARRKDRMAAFGAQRHPALAGRDRARDTQATARAQQPDHGRPSCQPLPTCRIGLGQRGSAMASAVKSLMTSSVSSRRR